MKNQVTLAELDQVIGYRLRQIGMAGKDASTVKDPLIKWYLIVRERIQNRK